MKKLLLAAIISLIPLTAHAGTFNDVDSSDIYEDGVELLADRDIVNGYSDNTFRPDNPVNRAEMLKILLEGRQTLGIDSTDLDDYEDDNCFNDVPAGEWYTKYVCAGKDFGIVEGYEGNLFLPARTVNFVEALKMSMETFFVPSVITTDVWYRGYVEGASSNNYIPFTINKFDKEMTRGEMSDMIARILSGRDGTLDQYLGDRQFIVVTYDTIEAGSSPETVEPGSSGSSEAQYLDYSDAELLASGDNDTIVLYFHANWCITCAAFERELSDSSQFARLPDNLRLLKIDYDNSNGLRSEYGITVQHSYVQVDRFGNEITRWIGGGIDTLLDKIQ